MPTDDSHRLAGGTAEERRRRKFSDRNDEFLRVALRRFRRHGLDGFSLTTLASLTHYSKGTWYNHFPSINSVIADIARVNAELQGRYFHELVSDVAANRMAARDALISVFFDYINHAIANPEMWTCALLARLWRPAAADSADEFFLRALHAEHDNRDIVRALALSRRNPPTESSPDDAAERESLLHGDLDSMRAVAAGLCILNVVHPHYTWALRTTDEQCVTVIRSALSATRLPRPDEADIPRLWMDSRERTRRLSVQWRISGDHPPAV